MKLQETTTCHVNKYMFDGFTNDGASNGINISCLDNGYRSQEDIALLSVCVRVQVCRCIEPGCGRVRVAYTSVRKYAYRCLTI